VKRFHNRMPRDSADFKAMQKKDTEAEEMPWASQVPVARQCE